MDISKLENGQAADIADVLNILEALGVEDERWTSLIRSPATPSSRAGGTRLSRRGGDPGVRADLPAGLASVA